MKPIPTRFGPNKSKLRSRILPYQCSAQQRAKPVQYVSDGSGRDAYVNSGSGGFINATLPMKVATKGRFSFHEKLRGYQKNELYLARRSYQLENKKSNFVTHNPDSRNLSQKFCHVKMRQAFTHQRMSTDIFQHGGKKENLTMREVFELKEKAKLKSALRSISKEDEEAEKNGDEDGDQRSSQIKKVTVNPEHTEIKRLPRRVGQSASLKNITVKRGVFDRNRMEENKMRSYRSSLCLDEKPPKLPHHNPSFQEISRLAGYQR